MRRRALVAVAAVVLAAAATLLSVEPIRARMTALTPVTIEDPATYWTRSGFVEMTPPIRLPSQDGRERIVIWLRLPEKSLLRVVRREGEKPALSYPPGTVADRVDMRDYRRPSSVADVRGTRFESGQEYFHVLRSLAPAAGSAGSPAGATTLLRGLEWKRGDAVAERRATDQMLARMAEARGIEEPSDDPMLMRFERRNDCGGCHTHDKPERRTHESGELMPNRGTDADGLYTIATVLEDEAPLETHRARDMNEGDPFIRIMCGDGSDATLSNGPRRRRHYTCAEGSVPRGRIDLRAALDANDLHGRAVCASRAYLAAHMDEEGRAAFSEAFRECGLP
jgi:hypothetical protein